MGRGDRSGSSCHGGVGNGGLRWQEWASENVGLLSRSVALLPRRMPRLGWWRGRVAADGDEGETRWLVVKSLRRERERDRSTGFRERRRERTAKKGREKEMPRRKRGLTTSELVEKSGGCRCVCMMISTVFSSSCNLCQIFNLT